MAMLATILGLVVALTTTTGAVAASDHAAPAGGARIMDDGFWYGDEPCYPDGWCVLGWFEIINSGRWKCLDAHSSYGGGNGNPVGLFDCNGGATTQWQVLWRQGRFDYQFQIRNRRNGRCLDYPASSGGADGWQYVLWDCVGSTGQWFRISDFNESTYGRLMTVQLAGITVGPNHHVDAFQVDGGGNGNRVGNYVWTGSALQHWYFRSL